MWIFVNLCWNASLSLCIQGAAVSTPDGESWSTRIRTSQNHLLRIFLDWVCLIMGPITAYTISYRKNKLRLSTFIVCFFFSYFIGEMMTKKRIYGNHIINHIVAQTRIYQNHLEPHTPHIRQTDPDCLRNNYPLACPNMKRKHTNAAAK